MSKQSSRFKRSFLFGISAIPDQLTYQIFQFLIFTFYFTVVRLPFEYLATGYIIWGIWNAINDPLIGALSERTTYKKKLGKRRFYIIISVVPLSLMMILLFYVPFDTSFAKFIYFLVVIMLFELFYSMFNVNMNAIFPDQFPNQKERSATQIYRNIMFVIALILSSIIPGLIISDLVPKSDLAIPQIKNEYLTTGIIIAIIIIVTAIPFIIWGVKEKEETVSDYEKRPSLFDSFKKTLKNKTFIKFVIANSMIWYTFSIIPMVIPIYAEYVLNLPKGALIVSLSLMSAFIVAAISMPIHRFIGSKIGSRNGLVLSLALGIIVLFPYFLITGEEFTIIFFITTALLGFPLGGTMFYLDLMHSDIIDEDSLKYGVRRGASFYGVLLLLQRLTIVLQILTIWLMFGTMGWEKEFIPIPDDPTLVVLGLKSLMFIFPAIALMIGIFALKLYSLHGEKLRKVREEIKNHPNLGS